MRRIGTLSIALLLVSACGHPLSRAQDDAKTQAASGASSSVHAIELPRYAPSLPQAPGRDSFAVACLSCHSTRYITMQPPLSAAKWEESVRKMMKTYGAPVAEDQVAAVVQYIMAAKEAGRGGGWGTPGAAAAERDGAGVAGG